MLLTITNTNPPATDLGYLLHKHPSRFHSFSLAFGQAYICYPEANNERCTVALLLNIDPIQLVRKRGNRQYALEQYVNDRPYVSSSFLSVAMAEVFRTAMSGRSKERPELAQTSLPLQAKVAVVPAYGGEWLLRQLFEPLGYQLSLTRHPLDEDFPQWGNSNYFTLELQTHSRLCDLLNHLYVLIPVLDDEKHYWVGEAEVEKLLHHGEGWLATHPAKDLITKRYLKHQSKLARAALARLMDDDNNDPDGKAELHAQEEATIEQQLSLNEQRISSVIAVLKNNTATRIIDLGCGEGKLIKALAKDSFFTEIMGMDVSYRALEIAHERLHLDSLPSKQQGRIKLLQSSLIYRDKRMAGYDAATVIEVIEHLDEARLDTFARVLFEFAQPHTIIITTPNKEYNVKWEKLPAGKFRHKDHRFEWMRQEFKQWAEQVAARFGYQVNISAIGTEDETVGAPTQMGVFTRNQAK